MASKIEKMLGAYQGNAYPAMLDELGDHLGVSGDSLRRLSLGWAPIVPFKKGNNYQGWWVIPERDGNAVPIGLALRSRADFKVMYPGSQHGLVYEVNSHHDRGSYAYKQGAHNWIRVANAGVVCPVCGKPDGCLVSSDNLEDPKAVICIRQREGATRPMKFGYLHIRKEEGQLKYGASALPASENPVLVVEGMTDTAAAMDLGFVAVGRPSNLACMGMLSDLVRGREVVVFGENDKVNPQTGKRPGHEGMIAAYQTLKTECPKIRMVLPPEHQKDFRQWVTSSELTAAQILEYVADKHHEPEENLILPDGKPLTMAKAWLNGERRMAGRYVLRYYREQWFRYAGSKYEEVDEKTDIRGPLYGWSDNKRVQVVDSKGNVSLNEVVCNRGLVGNVLEAMLDPALCPVNAAEAPLWINGAQGPDPTDLIPFKNGLLWVPRYLDGADESEYLLEPTPDYFTTFALPFAFDPTAKHPNWSRYLRSTVARDPEYVQLLQEWFGYNLTPDMSQEKMMLLRGPRRSGKGTALHALSAIVGKEQTAEMKLEDLTKNFGLEDLVGKQIILMNEVVLPKHGDGISALQQLLRIVGRDPVNIARKFKSGLASHKLKTRVTMTANALPQLPDNAGAMESRLLIIDYNTSFFEKEDMDLKRKLVEEAPGIVLWALRGLQRLRTQGRFTMPAASKSALAEWRLATSPMAAFIEECCDSGPQNETCEVGKQELFDCWGKWSMERGMRPNSKTRFFELVKLNAQFAVSATYQKGGHKFSVYQGLALKPWAAKQFLGKIN